MTIPAVEPPVGAPATGLPPGTKASQLTGAIDDSAGSGVVIPLNVVDDFGVDWRMAKLEGWDSPDLDEGADSKSGQDGLWDVENFYGGRTLTIEGVYTAPTYAEREAAAYRLVQAVPRNRLVTFRLDETTPKRVSARRSGRLMVRPLTDVIAEYSISMLAPDPRKYGVTPVVAPTISVSTDTGGLAPPWTPPVLLPEIPIGPSQTIVINAGIYESPPQITIRGPGTNVSIYNYATERQLAFDLTLGASDFLVVDCAAGSVLLNGTAPRAPRAGSCIVAEFMIQPGENLLRIFGDLTDSSTPPSADISFYSAWN